jgi:hypothetical protein
MAAPSGNGALVRRRSHSINLNRSNDGAIRASMQPQCAHLARRLFWGARLVRTFSIQQAKCFSSANSSPAVSKTEPKTFCVRRSPHSNFMTTKQNNHEGSSAARTHSNGNQLTSEQHQTVLALGECLFQLRTTRDRIHHLARSSEKQIETAYDGLVRSADKLFAVKP